jgi:hypothetical protein
MRFSTVRQINKQPLECYLKHGPDYFPIPALGNSRLQVHTDWLPLSESKVGSQVPIREIPDDLEGILDFFKRPPVVAKLGSGDFLSFHRFVVNYDFAISKLGKNDKTRISLYEFLSHFKHANVSSNVYGIHAFRSTVVSFEAASVIAVHGKLLYNFFNF